MPPFLLTTEPWIPVWDLDTEGPRDVGLAEALTRAHRLALATVTAEHFPILRVLTALYDAACGPASTVEWDSAWKADTLDTARITAYLDRWADSFDLFHPERPAFQAGGLTHYNRGPEALHPGRLGGESGVWFHPELLTGVRPWEPGHAARLLLHLLAYDPAGIKAAAPDDPAARGGKVYGGQISPLAGVTHAHLAISGHSIKDLLLLNLPPQPRTPGDRPVWERESPPVPMRVRSPAGRLDLLTWPGRRIRLHATADGMVDAVAHYDGDRVAESWGSNHQLDPMTAWRAARAGTPAPFPFLNIEQTPCIWRAASLLDNPANWAVLQHVIGAAERGVLPADLPLRAVMSTVVYSNRHRSTISDIAIAQMPLGTTGQLTDTETRTGLATMSRYTGAVEANLRKTAIDVSRLPSARIEHRTLFTNLDFAWEGALDASIRDLAQARTVWHQAIAEAANSNIDCLPLKPAQKEQIRATYLARPASDERGTRPKKASSPQPGPAKRRGGGPRAQRYEIFGGQYTLSGVSQHPDCVVSYKTLRDRVSEGWSVVDAATTPGRRGPRQTDTT
ncbi:type I-E CRISPR-associated protein Cse1/CasA [Streptomyces sp. RLB3-6]|uniref:type I-E CRISPR-associated protein Cse1/CasA n=1 Tax=Streptomyces sp. RLB3-6 TaxID=2594457 RepID=UPI0013E0A926|nr:type I-E CRISPR-associated protein Cse1/CasA [Streptomyces sp. RLB3-6]